MNLFAGFGNFPFGSIDNFPFRLDLDKKAPPEGHSRVRKGKLPVGLRLHLRVCRIFEIFVEELQRQVPHDRLETEVPILMDSFMIQSFDDSFLQIADSQPPFELGLALEFKAVVARHCQEVQLSEVKRRVELQLQVDGATFQKLSSDLHADLAQLEKFSQRVCEAQAAWAPQVQYYKRVRRARGVERVSSLMGERMNVVQLDGPTFADVPRKFAQFKAASLNSMPQLEETAASGAEFVRAVHGAQDFSYV